MKTAMQEMFSQLEIDQPQLFNINTTEGKTFVNSYIKFIELEKEQIERAFSFGYKDGYEGDLSSNSKNYYNTVFK